MVAQWSEPYRQTLVTFGARYAKASGTKNKQQIIDEAIQAIKNSHASSAELKGKSLPEDLLTVSITIRLKYSITETSSEGQELVS